MGEVVLDLDNLLVTTEDGQELPVTAMWDADDELTDDPEEAVRLECGPDRDDMIIGVTLYPPEPVLH